MFAYAAFRQFVAEHIEGGELTKPTNWVDCQKALSPRKAEAMVKAPHRLSGERVWVFRRDIRIHH